MKKTLKRSRLWFVVAGCAALVGAWPTTSQAQLHDHMECYRVRQVGNTTWTPNAHANDTFTLAANPSFVPPFVVEPGCKLQRGNRGLPNEICVSVEKQPSQPPSGANVTGYYACYAMRCPDPADNQDVQLANQFGSGSPMVRQKTSQRTVCVPTTIP